MDFGVKNSRLFLLGVMVAQKILVLLVRVRILQEKPLARSSIVEHITLDDRTRGQYLPSQPTFI